MSKELRKAWTRLGISFGETFSTKGYVDIERLILDTCREGQKDSRLFFAMRGWLLKHHDLVYGSRLIRMTKATQETAVLGALIDSVVEQQPRSHLKHVRKYCKRASSREFVFEEIKTSRVLSTLNEEENLSLWEKWNLVSRDMEDMRGVIAEKKYVFRYNRNLLLRALFGVGVRAEIWTYFLYSLKGNAHQIAQMIHQSYEPVYSELKLYSSLGLLTEEQEGKSIVYCLRTGALKKILKPLLAA